MTLPIMLYDRDGAFVLKVVLEDSEVVAGLFIRTYVVAYDELNILPHSLCNTHWFCFGSKVYPTQLFMDWHAVLQSYVLDCGSIPRTPVTVSKVVFGVA